MSDFDVSDSDVSINDVSNSDVSNRIRVNLDGLNMDDIEVRELCDSNDSGRLDNAHESDLDGQNLPDFNLDNDMSNPKLQVILEAKGKPILTMIEIIRTKIMCVPSHVGGDRCHVECGPDSQHVVDPIENCCSCKNWDLTGIHCMHAVAIIHLKD
ncbi:hypothetical protein Golob_005606 [Gossypium lobatum]|uniref:SWIM-type domain-containing protein n=1 Tax=Gossypium lobatum TaxID=34289 RepID=A0A7J8MU58_9ROSI|nr:hypothetical protein [Gossypium lobatum]